MTVQISFTIKSIRFYSHFYVISFPIFTLKSTKFFSFFSPHLNLTPVYSCFLNFYAPNIILIYFPIIIIMNTFTDQQNQKLTTDLKIFDRIYKRKFRQRRRIVASQFKPNKPEFIENFQQIALSDLKIKRKTVGSLLPKLKQIQSIAKSQKKSTVKQRSNSLTKLQVYLSHKNIRKQQQFNILFLTQNSAALSDKVLNQKFSQFVSVAQDERPKNLRALLNLAGGNEISQQAKKRKIETQKQQLTQIVKKMIEQQHKDENLLNEQNQNPKQAETLIENPLNAEKEKDIQWVLKQCKRYNKKYKIDGNNGSNKNKI